MERTVIIMWKLLLYSLFVHPAILQNSAQSILSTFLNDDDVNSCEVVFVTVKVANKTLLTPLESEESSAVLEPNHDALLSSSGVFMISSTVFEFNNNTRDVTFHRLKDIHRFAKNGQCGSAVIYSNKIFPGFKEWFFEVIIPRYLPIIRKDEDFFFFVFENEVDANKILLSPDFGQRIKFKMGIVLTSNVTFPVKLKQVNLFDKNGECTLKTIDSSSQVPRMKKLFLHQTNYNGKHLKIVSPKAPSYFETKLEKGRYTPVRGLYKVWLDEMVDKFNFTYTVNVSSASGSTGKRLKNGTWVGSVGDILSGRADMAPFNGHIYNRHPFVDWSAPITYEMLIFITHKPKSYFSPSAIYRPFPITLWIGFLIAVLLVLIIFKTISKHSYEVDLPIPTRAMVMFIFSSFLEQEAHYYMWEQMDLTVVRVLVSFWLLFSMVLSTVYKGKLVSLIAFPALTWIPTSFDELAYSDYRVGLNVFGKGGATYAVLSTSKSPIYEAFFQRLELYPDPVECLKAAFHDDLGCLMVKSVAEFFGAKNFTDKFGRSPFRISDQTALFREDGYIWEKRAVFRKHFDKVTWSMMDSGLSNLWFQQDLNFVKKKRLDWEKTGGHRIITFKKQDDGPSKLQMTHLVGIFYLFISGLFTGICCLIWEKAKNVIHKRKTKHLVRRRWHDGHNLTITILQ